MRHDHQTTLQMKQLGWTRQDGAAGVMALVVALVLMAAAAASLFLTVPESVDAAAATTAAALDVQVAEPPFHERYPLERLVESINSPTF
jgi:hypothetical protein